MSVQLFPKEIIENSAEGNFSKHSVRTKLIYSTAVIFIMAALAALPFIKTEISVRSPGAIRPVTERSQITSLVSGEIDELYIQENSPVKRGQKVAVISSPKLQEKLQFNIQDQQEITRYLNDLFVLLRMDSSSVFKPANLQTSKYNSSFLQFGQQLRNNVQAALQVQRKFQRKQQLYERDVISEAEYEKSKFALQKARNDFKLLFEQQMNTWQNDRVTYRDKLEQLKTEEQQLSKEREQYVITAPVSGTIQNMKGIYESSRVYPNQVLAEISPDTGLVAECYIPPKDIGLIREGMEARFQISAFDFNQWGLLKGEVKDISNDVTITNNQPVFTVQVSLDKTYLELKNGYRGSLKKGMTLQARFTVARRSLFQLLFDNVNDWLNPKWSQEQLATGSINSK